MVYLVYLMKLIIGLGNPEAHYNETRHNCGFSVIDSIAAKYEETWQKKTKLQGYLVQMVINAEPVLLLKPQTFYNDSGLSARLVKDFFKITNRDILAVHDDLALPFGTVRTRREGSDAGNNGIKSLNAHIGDDFFRIRIGIEQPTRLHSDTDFVLGKFTDEEIKSLSKIIKIANQIIHDFTADTFVPTSYKI